MSAIRRMEHGRELDGWRQAARVRIRTYREDGQNLGGGPPELQFQMVASPRNHTSSAAISTCFKICFVFAASGCERPQPILPTRILAVPRQHNVLQLASAVVQERTPQTVNISREQGPGCLRRFGRCRTRTDLRAARRLDLEGEEERNRSSRILRTAPSQRCGCFAHAPLSVVASGLLNCRPSPRQ
jgi:hypothetical protein